MILDKIIKYKESYTDFEMTEQQALASGEYDKVFIENDAIKKIERYDEFLLVEIIYYISTDENETEIVQQFTPLVSWRVNIISPKEPLETYFVERERDYRNNVLVSKARILYDAHGNEICGQNVNAVTDEPYHKGT